MSSRDSSVRLSWANRRLTGLLDHLCRSRLQVKRYSSVLDCARRTYAEEGIRGFFRGGMFDMSTAPSPRRRPLTNFLTQ